MNRTTVLSLLGLSCGFGFCSDETSSVDFHQHIRPILEDNCLKCHGPDKQKSDFRVDDFSILVAGGGSGIPGIVPGDPLGSYLLELVTTDDEDDRMPPIDEGEGLTADEIDLLSRWVEQGAPGPMAPTGRK